MTSSTFVDIHGSCVTRDAFEIGESDYKVGTYISRNSIFSTIKPGLPLVETEFESAPNYLKRMVYYDFNKLVFKKLKKNNSGVIVIDLIDERFDLLNMTGVNPNGEIYSGYITNSSNFNKTDILKNHPIYRNASVLVEDKYARADSYIEDAVHRYANSLKKIYDSDKIILHYATCAGHYRTKDGKIKSLPKNILDEAQKLNKYYSRVYRVLFKNFNQSPVIRIKNHCIADETHKWGLESFHYIPEYYQEFMQEFTNIVGKFK